MRDHPAFDDRAGIAAQNITLDLIESYGLLDNVPSPRPMHDNMYFDLQIVWISERPKEVHSLYPTMQYALPIDLPFIGRLPPYVNDTYFVENHVTIAISFSSNDVQFTWINMNILQECDFVKKYIISSRTWSLLFLLTF